MLLRAKEEPFVILVIIFIRVVDIGLVLVSTVHAPIVPTHTALSSPPPARPRCFNQVGDGRVGPWG